MKVKLDSNIQIVEPIFDDEDIVGLVNEGKVWLSSNKNQQFDNGLRPITGLDET